MSSIENGACIVGVGETAFTRHSGQSVLGLVIEASVAAAADAGIKPEQIDGVVNPSYFYFTKALAASLSIPDLRYSIEIRMGGASPAVALQNAAMAVSTGVAEHVLVALRMERCLAKPSE